MDLIISLVFGLIMAGFFGLMFSQAWGMFTDN